MRNMLHRCDVTIVSLGQTEDNGGQT